MSTDRDKVLATDLETLRFGVLRVELSHSEPSPLPGSVCKEKVGISVKSLQTFNPCNGKERLLLDSNEISKLFRTLRIGVPPTVFAPLGFVVFTQSGVFG
ncbi:hypothetical protein DICVIV_07160 [Dictyocaulus viviparus]|uniref:Uncharacterized protein n=1 Tax=Dictyocaulus viviparus TaxID=29172 RepID=A0A0D8XQJ2_DICVI|nr:hypothetical protein DICVIV_07160 [Dictyocaulus viviparus]